MNEAVESLYFNWLCSNVIDARNTTDPSQTYWDLLKVLHGTEFVWVVPMDENRAEDGKDLRREFIILANTPDDQEWRNHLGCSVLEMLVAFSRRAEHMTDIPAKTWFWEFLENLGLRECSDAVDMEKQDIVEALETFIWRTYEADGKGGLFPMYNPLHDQRQVEIWYQFCEYLEDHNKLP